MNFFKKLLNLDSKEATIQSIELKEWLESVSEDVLKNINNKLKNHFRETEQYKKELKLKLLGLEEEDLENPNIPEREKHMMQGNRIHYVQKTRKFIEEIELPTDEDYLEVESFCNEFDIKLKDFDSGTSKAYFLLTHFFDNKMKEIASLIKKIEQEIISILKLVKTDQVRQYKALLLKIRELNEASVISERISSEIKENKFQIEQLEKRKNKLVLREADLKQSKEYNNFNKFEKQKIELDGLKANLNSRLNNALKSFDKPLRKFMHNSLKKDLIQNYLDEPLLTLEKDKTLQIVQILDKLKKEIKSKKIDVKDNRQKEKFLHQIEHITKEYLSDIASENREIKEKRAQVNELSEKLHIMMDFKEIQYQLDHISEKLNTLNIDIESKEKILENLQEDKKAERLEKALSEFTGYSVHVT